MGLLSKAKKLWINKNAVQHVFRNSKPNFSQYAEDVVFERLLKPGPRGTYLDVGANHPINGSNTFSLYLRGWTGLTIDPNPKFAALHRRFRPKDVFLAEGVSRIPSKLRYFAFEHDVFSTFDADRASRLVSEGHEVAETRDVACRPLSELIAAHLAGKQIDLLNIDCEGMDLDAILSINFEKSRPTVMIVEDFKMFHAFKNGQTETHFERSLRDLGYRRIAQSAWSAIFLADDWDRLFRLSDAYDAGLGSNGYIRN